jgi:hypothetical protein
VRRAVRLEPLVVAAILGLSGQVIAPANLKLIRRLVGKVRLAHRSSFAQFQRAERKSKVNGKVKVKIKVKSRQ